MSRLKTIAAVALACCGIGGVVLLGRRTAPQSITPAPQHRLPAQTAATPVPTGQPLASPATSALEEAPAPPNTSDKAAAGFPQPSAKTPVPAPPVMLPGPRRPAADDLAREALSWVGVDPEAEQYWIEAINDPTLPAEERRNLIEDLNEDGLSNPKHPTLDDLPLLIYRIRLIEDLAQDATDQVNFEAFAEAYKDLANLVELAQGRGEPVR